MTLRITFYKFHNVNLNSNKKRFVFPVCEDTSTFALEFTLGNLIMDLCFFPRCKRRVLFPERVWQSCGMRSPDEYALKSTNAHISMARNRAASPYPPSRPSRFTSHTFRLRFRVSVSGKNIVSAVCKCLETRHQDIRYRRDLSSWQFRTEHPFRSHRFPPYPLWPPGIHSLCALQLSRSHHIALLNTPSRSRTAAKVAYMINRAFPTGYCLCVYVETLAERLNCVSFVPRQMRESDRSYAVWHRHVSITA